MRRVMTAALAALAILSAATTGDAQMRRGPEFFPNLPVVNQNGETLKFYDDLIKDKIVIVMFIYTSCTDICPLTTARMTLIEDKLGPAIGRDIFIVSMTVDPEVDTPEKLKAYSKSFATGPGWTFVTGKPEDIRAINYRLGERSKILSDHRNEIVLGNDVTGEWQRDNVMGDLDRVVTTIREMDPKWRAQVQPAARNSADEHRPGDGHAARTGDVQEDLCALPHHRSRRQGRTGPARRHRAARPCLACELSAQSASDAGDERSGRARAGGKVRSGAHAEPAAVRTGCRRSDQLPAAGKCEARGGTGPGAAARAQALTHRHRFRCLHIASQRNHYAILNYRTYAQCTIAVSAIVLNVAFSKMPCSTFGCSTGIPSAIWPLAATIAGHRRCYLDCEITVGVI
jgi:cytochrome oxidase Cu insertion factor (SCO1/SenC/PrrC family)